MKLITAIGSSVAALTSFGTTSFVMSSDDAAWDWWTPLDHYCERVGVGFWAEPFNALINGEFIITGNYTHPPTTGKPGPTNSYASWPS
jgi:hypothetical protein